MIITYHNVEVKRCLAPFDTIAIVENNMHKEKEKREKHESGRTKKKTDGAFVNPPFYCDYGKNIEVGKNFFANYNCTIIDVAKVKIGDNSRLEKARRDRSHAKSFSYARPVLRLRSGFLR